MKNRGKNIALVAAGIVIGAAISGPAASAATQYLAERSTMPFFVNGSPVTVDAYLINNNNYLKLRDIAALADFGVTWSPESNAVLIDTMVGYTPEGQAAQPQEQAGSPAAPAQQTAYHQQANAAVFNSVYTAEAYDALRQCMAEGKSAEITMTAETRAAMWSVVGALGSHPAYNIKSGGNGAVYFVSEHPTAYEEAAKAARKFVDSLAGKSERDKLYAFARYVCERLDYDANSTTTPDVLFSSNRVNKGNCMSFAHNFQYLCDVAGIPCVLVDSDIHQWAEVYTDGRWYNVDLTSFDHHYTQEGWELLGVESDLQGKIYRQPDPLLAKFAKELLVPGSTK